MCSLASFVPNLEVEHKLESLRKLSWWVQRNWAIQGRSGAVMIKKSNLGAWCPHTQLRMTCDLGYHKLSLRVSFSICTRGMNWILIKHKQLLSPQPTLSANFYTYQHWGWHLVVMCTHKVLVSILFFFLCHCLLILASYILIPTALFMW